MSTTIPDYIKRTIAAVGDINGDGRDDIIMEAHGLAQRLMLGK
ncbi:MAG: FG-GAP repeat protein [Candidatus Midichloria sp.]|nr:FG-GAP repeat protein [Candidatus Midichloria sp.]